MAADGLQFRLGLHRLAYAPIGLIDRLPPLVEFSLLFTGMDRLTEALVFTFCHEWSHMYTEVKRRLAQRFQVGLTCASAAIFDASEEIGACSAAVPRRGMGLVVDASRPGRVSDPSLTLPTHP